MTIIEEIIELENVNRQLDRIKNDPSYIDKRVQEIFGNKEYAKDAKAGIEAILDQFSTF